MNQSVYFTNLSDYDITTALAYVKGKGSVKAITRGKINIFRTDPLVEKIYMNMDEMQEQDWLVLAGNSFVCSLCCSVMYKRFGKLKLLIWDAVERSYRPVKTTMERNYNASEFHSVKV
jgi:hypothetical protein